MKARVIKTGEMVDVYHEPQHGQITNIYKESILVNGRMWTEEELDFCVKANKAPEKIYIDPVIDLPKLIGHIDKNSIEYTRTDTFIEKTISWLREQDEMIGVSFQEDFLERFKNYVNYRAAKDCAACK